VFDSVPSATALTIGPLTIGWYGIGYAVGLAAAYLLLIRLSKRAGEDPDILGNGMIIVAIAALIGGRAYHVIDQWEELYKSDPIKIFLPPYSGLGVYGGIITGTIAAFLYARWKHAPFLRWADIVAPGLFVMQAIARWGNYFNQELYGPPTTLPWGIPIDCAHRIAAYPCEQFPFETTRFQPLFLYESLSGIVGCLVLVWIGYHWRPRLRVGDLLLGFFIWYGLTRFLLETLREDNWLFFGVPVAQLVSLAFIIPSIALLLYRHRPGHAPDAPPTRPAEAIWGAIGSGDASQAWRSKPIDEPWANVPWPEDEADAPPADAPPADADAPASDAPAADTAAPDHAGDEATEPDPPSPPTPTS
jgi:phosphatidylglycerol:prolipoprotein diacylglycerol transferase